MTKLSGWLRHWYASVSNFSIHYLAFLTGSDRGKVMLLSYLLHAFPKQIHQTNTTLTNGVTLYNAMQDVI
jgi:hypothetical protein